MAKNLFPRIKPSSLDPWISHRVLCKRVNLSAKPVHLRRRSSMMRLLQCFETRYLWYRSFQCRDPAIRQGDSRTHKHRKIMCGNTGKQIQATVVKVQKRKILISYKHSLKRSLDFSVWKNTRIYLTKDKLATFLYSYNVESFHFWKSKSGYVKRIKTSIELLCEKDVNPDQFLLFQIITTI